MTNYTKYLNRLGTDEASDEVYTPMEALEPFIPFMRKSWNYYEPTSGISSKLVDGLRYHGFSVTPSGDTNFFDLGPSDLTFADAIITNPPYSKKDKFIEHCYTLGKPFALLLPVSSLQGQNRGRLFKDYGLDAVVLNRRVDFTGGGSPNFGNVWVMSRGFSFRADPDGWVWFEEN